MKSISARPKGNKQSKHSGRFSSTNRSRVNQLAQNNKRHDYNTTGQIDYPLEEEENKIIADDIGGNDFKNKNLNDAAKANYH